MFNFDVQYILDKRHTAADELSRRSHKFSNNINEIHEKNINNFIDDHFNYMQIYSMRVNENDDEQSLKNEYSEKF